MRITKLNKAQNCRRARDPMSKSQRLSLLLHNSRKAIDGGHLQQIGNLWVIVSRINLLQTDNSRSYDTSSNVTMFVGQPQYYKRILTRSIIMKIISTEEATKLTTPFDWFQTQLCLETSSVPNIFEFYSLTWAITLSHIAAKIFDLDFKIDLDAQFSMLNSRTFGRYSTLFSRKYDSTQEELKRIPFF